MRGGAGPAAGFSNNKRDLARKTANDHAKERATSELSIISCVMYLFSRPTGYLEKSVARPRAVEPKGRRWTRCFATSTIRERVKKKRDSKTRYNFILLRVVAFSRLRASSRDRERHAKRVASPPPSASGVARLPPFERGNFADIS